jgi:hypothetical protein
MRRQRGSRGGKEPGHDITRQPGRGIEARSRGEIGQAVLAADPLRGRQAAAEPVADHGLHRFGLRVVTIIENVPIKIIDAQRQRGSLLKDRSVPLMRTDHYPQLFS